MRSLLRYFLYGSFALLALPVQANDTSQDNSKIKIWPVSAFVIANEANEGMVSIKSAVKIQQQINSKWKTAIEGNLFEITNKTIDCYNLSSNSNLTIGPWNGMSCLTALCDKNVPLPDGIYRYVLVTCDGKKEFTTPSFEKTWDESK